MNPPAPGGAVGAVFESYPENVRTKLLAVRDLIFSTAASMTTVGPLTETLKWGEPAYLTEQSRSGSTIRLGWKASAPGQYAIYFNCQTSLVDTFRTLHPELVFEGNRALLLAVDDDIPVASLDHCIELALTYHRWKKRGVSRIS